MSFALSRDEDDGYRRLMKMPLIIVSGASGQHATVVYEAATLSGRKVLGFIPASGWPQVLDCSCVGGPETLRNSAVLRSASFVVACGSNVERKRLSDLLIADGAELETVIHPAAVVSPSVSIGDGTMILAGAIVAASARIGRSCIINHGASIDHNCELGDYVNICPGVHLGGNCRIGNGAFVGIGASVVQGVEIGADAVVGAGAVVLRNVPPKATVAAVPAKPLPGKLETGAETEFAPELGSPALGE